MFTPEEQERLLVMLDEIDAAHTTAALYASEVRTALTRQSMRASGSNPAIPYVNASKLTVEWSGKVCVLKESLTFRLMQVLCRRPGHVIAFDQLMRQVWGGHLKSPDTVRSTVRHLKHKLKEADMVDLAFAVKARGKGYCLSLPHC